MSFWQDILVHGLSRIRVVHRLPGRLRLHIPLISRIPQNWHPVLEMVEKLLPATGKISMVRVEPRTGNVLILYNPALSNEEEILEGLRTTLAWAWRHHERLGSLSPSDVETMIHRFREGCAEGIGAYLAETLQQEFSDALRP